MRTLFFTALLSGLALLVGGGPSISLTLIDAGKQFVQERGRLGPGQRAALVRNLSEQQARLDFRITGRTSGLGMGYEALRK